MKAAGVDRHLGMLCCCSLLDCCHDENGQPFNCGHVHKVHVHSGSPRSGWLYPWTQEEYDADKRYWSRPDPDGYPEGSLERLVTEYELKEWRQRELARIAASEVEQFGSSAGS